MENKVDPMNDITPVDCQYIFQDIHEIKATKGAKAKQKLFAKLFENLPGNLSVALKYVYMVYSPRLNYFIKEIPQAAENGSHDVSFSNDLMDQINENICQRKITGNAAREWIANLRGALTPESDQMLVWMLNRSFDCGLKEKSINKALKDYRISDFDIIEIEPYMRCSTPKPELVEKLFAKGPVCWQLKYDGLYMAVVDFEAAYSRQGSDLSAILPYIIKDEINDDEKAMFTLTGEVVVYDEGNQKLPRKESNGIINSIVNGDGKLPEGHTIQYHCWDAIETYKYGEGKDTTPYDERYENGVRLIDHFLFESNVSMCETFHVANYAEADVLFRKALSRGEEGGIIKSLSMIWKDGTSADQIKMKVAAESEFEIIGFNPGNGKYANTLGSLQYQSSDGLIKGDVSGMTDAERDDFWNNQDFWIHKIITICYNDIIHDKRYPDVETLYLPRYVEPRMDKTIADDYEKVYADFKSAMTIEKAAA